MTGYIVHEMIDYIIYQITVFCAVLVATGRLFSPVKKGNGANAAVFWLLCLSGAVLISVYDAYAESGLLYMITGIASWLVCALWLYFIERKKPLNTLFYIFYAFPILLIEHVIERVWDMLELELRFGALPWLFAHAYEWGPYLLISLRVLLIALVVFAAEQLLLRRFSKEQWQMDISWPLITMYCLIAILSFGLSRLENQIVDLSRSLYYLLMACEGLYGMMAVMAMVMMAMKVSEEKKRIEADADLKLTRELWAADQKRYQFIRDNIDIINIKCHDMRHYLNHLDEKGSDSAVRSELDAIGETIEAYDSIVSTGNPVCDVILSEKSMQCLERKIHFFCVVDGKALGFMDDVSIYTLLGNAAENAIHYVDTLDDPEKRFINLDVRRNGNMTVITAANVLEEDLTFANGLPVSGAGDDIYHGFGMRSMRAVAEKYGGEMLISTEDGMFLLTIILPYSEKAE